MMKLLCSLTFLGLKKNKKDIFQELVRKKISRGEISNNYQLYNFTLDNGHIGKHAASVLRKM